MAIVGKRDDERSFACVEWFSHSQLVVEHCLRCFGGVRPAPRTQPNPLPAGRLVGGKIENQKRDLEPLGQIAEFLAVGPFQKRRVDNDRKTVREQARSQVGQLRERLPVEGRRI